MVHYYLYWPTGYLYGTLPSHFGPLAIYMVHNYLLLANWISLWYTTLSYWLLDITRIHYHLLLTLWISIWYTTLSYCSTGYLYGTLLSSTGPLNISMVHYPLLLAHWLSLWYTPIFYRPTGYLCGTLPSLISPLIIPMIHCYLLLATGYHYGTLLYPIGQLAIPMLHCYMLLALWIFLWYTPFSLLAHWLSLCYPAIFCWQTGYLDGTLAPPIDPLVISMEHYYLLLAH